MDLREAVRDSHKRAEQTELSKLMITGGMRKDTYAAFIENMQVIYAELERDGMIAKPEVLRNKIILQDIVDMDYEPCVIAPNVKNYVQYLSGLSANDRWAHVYVHYLGNMYGGQMIGKQLPGPHAHLTFEDLKGCIAYVRANITDIHYNEANAAFDWTMRIYDELYQLFG
jgi:heme oxygenase